MKARIEPEHDGAFGSDGVWRMPSRLRLAPRRRTFMSLTTANALTAAI
jgi:hypothetical protein